MKNLTFLVILCISLSCQKKDNGGDNHGLSYSVDTVVIDSKGRLLYLEGLFFTSDLNGEESSIFLFNNFDDSIDEVNLENLAVENNYPFEAEGPDGIGEHISSFKLLKDDLFFFKSFSQSAVFNRNGALIKKFDWINSIDSNGLKYGEIPPRELVIDSDNLKVFGLSYDFENRDVFLDVLSVQENRVNRFDIDPSNAYHNFVIALDDPQDYTYMDPLVYMMYENYLILSHQYSSEIILFNSEGEFVRTVYYDPKMTPRRAKDLASITSTEQINKEYQYLLEQVRFGPPVWDNVGKRYLRLSAKRVFSDIREKGSFLPEMKEINVYLSVFDAEFNLISELAIPELTSEYVKYFANDGKLWVSQNFSDELGFIVVDIPLD